ncbi:MAG: hypothetical protein AB1679_24810 [Actinomycetota bacterium]
MTTTMHRAEAAQRRAALRMAAAGAFLGLAATGGGLILAWVVPVISTVVLLGYGMILGGIFGALVGAPSPGGGIPGAARSAASGGIVTRRFRCPNPMTRRHRWIPNS